MVKKAEEHLPIIDYPNGHGYEWEAALKFAINLVLVTNPEALPNREVAVLFSADAKVGKRSLTEASMRW